MIIDITSLNLNEKNIINVDEILNVDEEEIKKTELIDIKDIKIKGTISKNNLNNYILNLNVEGIMILPCSRTLEPTEYHFNFDIDEEYEEKTKKIQKTIDIFPIIWENILMEIPIRVINPKADKIKTKGDGWELITDSDNKGHNSLAKLKDLL